MRAAYSPMIVSYYSMDSGASTQKSNEILGKQALWAWCAALAPVSLY